MSLEDRQRRARDGTLFVIGSTNSFPPTKNGQKDSGTNRHPNSNTVEEDCRPFIIIDTYNNMLTMDLCFVGAILPSLGMLALLPVSSGSTVPETHMTAAALRPRVDFAVIPRLQNERRKTQSTSGICDTVITTVFATDPLSRAACTCESTDAKEYTLTCDYTKFCGTFCSGDEIVSDGRYKCFDRTDYYTVVVTDDFIVNTLYEGCGTYTQAPHTTVCYNESRNMEGAVTGRCLQVDNQSCHCTAALCEGYVYRCISPDPASPWSSFVLDECTETAYADINPNQVHALLSSDIFDLTSCFGNGTPPPLTSEPTAAPTKVPTSSILEPEQDDEPTSTPTRTPSVPPTPGPTGTPTEVPSMHPTPRTTRAPVSRRPTRPPSPSPTSQPTPNPTMAPVSSPTSSPSVAHTSIPSTKPSGRPTFAPSATPSTASPTAETVDVSLAPFSIWFVKDPKWELSALIASVQRLLVSGLQSRYGTSLYDFRLQCTWVDGAVYSQPTKIRMECTGVSKFFAGTPRTEGEIAQAQSEILADVKVVSNQISADLGQSVEVTEASVDLPTQARENGDEETEKGVTASSTCSTWPLSTVPFTSFVLLALFI